MPENKIDSEIRERLYRNLAPTFVRGIEAVVESRKPASQKIETLSDMMKTAYQAGLDRGYDMGAAVFGEQG